MWICESTVSVQTSLPLVAQQMGFLGDLEGIPDISGFEHFCVVVRYPSTQCMVYLPTFGEFL